MRVSTVTAAVMRPYSTVSIDRKTRTPEGHSTLEGAVLSTWQNFSSRERWSHKGDDATRTTILIEVQQCIARRKIFRHKGDESQRKTTVHSAMMRYGVTKMFPSQDERNRSGDTRDGTAYRNHIDKYRFNLSGSTRILNLSPQPPHPGPHRHWTLRMAC